MKMRTKQSGFTLIELLVVIAIIGILSAVILTSLSSARQKGKDAKIKSEMNSLKNASELYFPVGNTYNSSGATVYLTTTIPAPGTQPAPHLFRDTSSNMNGLLTSICTNLGCKSTDPSRSKIAGAVTPTAWAFAVKLSSGKDFLCIDNKGTLKSSRNAAGWMNGTNTATNKYPLLTLTSTVCQ